MIVDADKIREAKEILGDRNADLIIDWLGVTDYDERNKKSCCPYHSEKTPSFVYNPRNYSFHCFGCGITVDVIDVLMQKGHTFLSACKVLFDEAGIQYSFGEEGVKTRSAYRYPHDESSEIAEITPYWNKRKISTQTLEYAKVGSDGKGNTVFRFYDANDVLTMVKYRPARSIRKGEIKTWCQKDADTSPILFNMNQINPANPLLICEGECDCLSAIEAGYYNTVSVPLGCQNLHWIEECWDWLEQFQTIIIAFDNDHAGTEARKQAIYRLGTWRTKYIDYPKYKETADGRLIAIKDMNDVLQAFGESYTLSMITSAKDVPVDTVVDFADVNDIDISEMTGVKTGLKPLDTELIKLFDGTLTILSGRPGSGKTSLIDQAIAHTVDDGHAVFLFSKEMPEAMSRNWLNQIMAGRRNMEEKVSMDGRPYTIVSYSAKRAISEYYRGKLFIYKDSAPNDIEHVMKTMEDCVRKYGVKLLVIDNLMMLDLECNETEKYTAQTNLVNELIKFASKFNVAVVLVAHPRKTQDMQSDIEMYDIAGSSNIINLAMRSIGLRRVSKKEQEDPSSKFGRYNVVLTIMKDRLLGRADVQIGLYYDVKSRRFFTNYEEFDYQYQWDQKVYTDKLDYPVKEEQTPFD